MRFCSSVRSVVQRPSTEIFIDVARGDFQVALREFARIRSILSRTTPDFVITTARTFLSPRREKWMCSSASFGTAGDRNRHVLRDQRQHVRRALHELLHIVGPAQRLSITSLVLLRNLLSGRYLRERSTGKRQPVGTRPADVCGCSRYPASVKSDITLRMLAGLNPSLFARDRVRDPIGSPVIM